MRFAGPYRGWQEKRSGESLKPRCDTSTLRLVSAAEANGSVVDVRSHFNGFESVAIVVGVIQ